MKRTYKLLGYLLLGIGVYAFLNANNTDLQANSTVTQEQTPYKRNRHTITLVLSQLSDLKVKEGQRINVGDIISDRTTERTKLQAKKQRLEASLSRARLPLRELKPVPEPKFQSELAALKQAQFQLDAIARQVKNFDQKFYHKDPWHVQVFESEKVQELADLKRRELDIKKCFDRINHSSIMENLIAPSGLKLGIWRCLKAGTNVGYPEQGTPQGGVCSPLLANIALNGIENIHNSVRYADDMVIILKPKDNAEAILGKIKEFLAARGMEISEQKTRVTATTDGFDFLGWNFQVQKNGKFRSRPSEDNFKAFRKKVKTIINCSNYGAVVKAKKLAPIVRGWRNYHKYCKMDGARNTLYFIQKRAFKVFNKEKKQNRYTSKKLLNQAFPAVSYSENKFVNVKGDKSSYDGDIIYWSKRNSKLYDGETSKALQRQSHSCACCGLQFMTEERVHLHHIDGNHDNWKQENLVAIHESCHDYLHMSKAQS